MVHEMEVEAKCSEKDAVVVVDQEASVSTENIVTVGKYTTVLSNPPTITSEQKEAKKQAWKRQLHGVKHVVAPMVDQSELAFRMMMRKHGADLCFSPMIHAHLFVNDLTYRKGALATCASDRPLVVQFCANEPASFLSACLLVEHLCDGVDLNLGCPQLIARRGHYGAYLQEDLDLVCQMVSLVHSHCRIALSCKIRILDDIEETIAYARALEQAGACMLTVHGRTREQRGANTGLANWNAIRTVRDAIGVPLLANGNIQMPKDMDECLSATGASAVMSAEGILANPFLFEGKHEPNWKVAREYLQYALRYKANVSAIRAHLFRICHHSLLEYGDLRERMSYVFTLREFHEIINDLEDRVSNNMNTQDGCKTQASAPCPTNFAHWMCKPYFRPRRDDSSVSSTWYREKRRAELDALAEETGLSRRQIRKREKRKIQDYKQISKRQSYPKCQRCSMPASQGCTFLHCRNCCRYKTTHERLDCTAHNLHFSGKPRLNMGQSSSSTSISSSQEEKV